MDLKNIYKHIFFTVISSIGEVKSPIAYINIKLGNKCTFSQEEIVNTFNELKWDSPISSADLNIENDDSLNCILKVEEISDFFDEDGNCDIFKVDEKIAYLR